MPNVVSFTASIAELALGKNRILNHSPSLFDVPGTEEPVGIIGYQAYGLLTYCKPLSLPTNHLPENDGLLACTLQPTNVNRQTHVGIFW